MAHHAAENRTDFGTKSVVAQTGLAFHASSPTCFVAMGS
jgi:hypothetical protein